MAEAARATLGSGRRAPAKAQRGRRASPPSAIIRNLNLGVMLYILKWPKAVLIRSFLRDLAY